MLYADGELSAQEQQAVEVFIKENPDVANELKMLMQTRLEGDEMIFADKNSLYKTDDAKLNLNNCEEQFLLYVDDELNAAEKNTVETFVLQHPQIQEDFILLKQTKIEPETIIFSDKKLLYRKNERPFIYFSFSRIAMAAAFIGFLFLIWNVIPVKNKTPDQIVSTKNKTVTPDGNKVLNNKIVVGENNTSVVARNKSEKKELKIFKQIVLPTTNETNKLIADNNNEEKKPSVSKTVRENIIDEKKTIIAPVSNNEKQLAANNSIVSPVEEKNIFHQTVYKELNTDEEERKNNIYVGNVELNREKVRGFFKRAKAAFSKTKNDDDNNVAIANFSINTKSLK